MANVPSTYSGNNTYIDYTTPLPTLEDLLHFCELCDLFKILSRMFVKILQFF